MADSKSGSSIEKQIEALPPLPTTVSRVMDVLADAECSANNLVKAILPDQAMCVAILKIANSVLYGRPKKVSSLETAVMVLGFNEIQSIVLGKAAVTTFNKLFKNHQHILDHFWNHAFTCGLAARVIGENINLKSGQFFMAGLLHDIGKLAMLLAFKERYETDKWMSDFSSKTAIEEERRIFSISHDIIGARLLKRWQFPDNLVAALQFHHSPDNATQAQGYPLIIQAADFLAHMSLKPETPDENTLKAAFRDCLPDFETLWKQHNLPWEDITLESWFAWLKVDKEHGSDILDVLTS